MTYTIINDLIQAESDRQSEQLSLIASENYASKAVMEANGSILTNKYAEGYPGKRYYAGNEIIDKIEEEAIKQAKLAFNTDYHVNVQPYSGSPANLAAYASLLKPGDTILSMSLDHGGHLTHGHSVSLTSRFYQFVHYGVDKKTELIDYDQVLQLAKEHSPKLIICGATAYPALVDFTAFARIAREVGAWLMVDMSHFSGLVAGKVYPTPFGIADIITSTTHKTLRGPRSAVIFCRSEYAKVVDKAIFPGLQGGPHMHTIAAKAVAFSEATQPSFHLYAKQIVSNAQTLAYGLQRRGLRLVSDGTDTHLFLLDLSTTGLSGQVAQKRLEDFGLIVNMNKLPFDIRPATDPSGLRIGTPALTSRGMKEKEMEELADCINQILTENTPALAIKEQVASLAKRFRIPAHY